MNEQDDFITRHPLLTIIVGAALCIGIIYAGGYFVSWLMPKWNALFDEGIEAFDGYLRSLGK